MGVNRQLLKNKNRKRPKKSLAERRRREKGQIKRLDNLGVGAEVTRHMTAGEIRAELRTRERHPVAAAS